MGSFRERPDDYGDTTYDLIFEAARYGNLTDDELIKYQDEMTTKQDMIDYFEEKLQEDLKEAVEKATKEATALGMQQGMQQGRQESCQEIAARMKAAGISADIIASCTGLTLEKIAEL